MAASTALHLRVGDVNCGTQLAERTRRPFPPQFYASKISTGMRVYIFAAAHFSAASSHTSHSCDNATREYVQQVLTVSNGTLAPAASVDCDLCSMVAAKHFIQGQGCFSAVRALPFRCSRSTEPLLAPPTDATPVIQAAPRSSLICSDCGRPAHVLPAKYLQLARDSAAVV